MNQSSLLNKTSWIVLSLLTAILGYTFGSKDNAEPASTNHYNHANSQHTSANTDLAIDSKLSQAIATKQSNFYTYGYGTVTKLLPDDNNGSRHQRFLATLPTHERLLFAHNIDLAPRIDQLSVGDKIQFKGVFESNAHGGVIHWTHSDPHGNHPAGYLKHNGTTYQ